MSLLDLGNAILLGHNKLLCGKNSWVNENLARFQVVLWQIGNPKKCFAEDLGLGNEIVWQKDLYLPCFVAKMILGKKIGPRIGWGLIFCGKILLVWQNGPPSMKKSYVSVLISVVKLELAAPNILKMMDIG